MTKTTLQTLRAHWENLREGRQLPLRSEIDPRAMPDVLDNLFILEKLNPTDIRVRIAGLTLCEMMGMEVRGQSPETFFSDNARGRFAAVITDVMERPTIAQLGLDTTDKMGNEATAEMILLPLRSDFGDVSRVIGCVSAPDKGFAAPVRFHVRSVDMEPVFQDKTDNPASTFGFAEPKVGFIMDGTSAFRAIRGGGTIRQNRTGRAPNYLKLVD